MRQFVLDLKQYWNKRPFIWYEKSSGSDYMPCLPSKGRILVLGPHPDDPESVAITCRILDQTGCDIQYAIELGYSVKLVGVIEQKDGVFNVSVHPALVSQASLLGSLEGVYNGIELEDEYGVISGLVAPGAGTYPTADAIIKDLVDIAEGRTLPMPDLPEALVLGSTKAVERRYYLRFSVADEVGVLAQICNIFWKYNISIAAIIQKEAVSKEFIPVIMTTHLAKEGDLQMAIAEVDKLDVVKVKTKIVRILSTDK